MYRTGSSMAVVVATIRTRSYKMFGQELADEKQRYTFSFTAEKSGGSLANHHALQCSAISVVKPTSLKGLKCSA